MQQLQGPFLIKFLGSYQDDSCLYLSMEYAAGGELFSLMYNSRANLANDVAKFYAVEMLSAVGAIHSLGFVYRDLRPENVLLDSEGHIKLVDFGNTKNAGADGICHTLLGEAEYLAPEMLASAVNAGAGYSNAVDYWALACVVFEMLVGRTPFSTKSSVSYADMHTHVMKGDIQWRGVSKEAKELLQQMLNPDPSSRICTAQDITAHSHFAGVRWDKVIARETIVPWVPVLQHTGDVSHYYRYPDPHEHGGGEATGPASGRASHNFLGF
jgi:serine/threonine protein kinase